MLIIYGVIEYGCIWYWLVYYLFEIFIVVFDLLGYGRLLWVVLWIIDVNVFVLVVFFDN